MRDKWAIYYDRVSESSDEELGEYVRKYLTDEAIEKLYDILVNCIVDDVEEDEDDR